MVAPKLAAPAAHEPSLLKASQVQAFAAVFSKKSMDAAYCCAALLQMLGVSL